MFWTVYVVFKTYLNVSSQAEASLTDQLLLLEFQLVFLFVKIPLVYTCFYIIDQYLARRWTHWVSILTLVTSFSLAVISMTLLNHGIVLPLIFQINSLQPVFGISSLMYHFFTLIFVTGAAVSIRLFRKQYQFKLRESELSREKTEAELKYLKSQINPHFLFNTLNNIYSLARKKSDQTDKAVLKLSKLMRFMLYETGSDTILLTNELMVIQDYIELEKLRYSDRLTVTYKESIDNPEQQIAPLILIHFVENAFKHGTSESRFDSYITIEIRLEKNILHANFINSKIEKMNEENIHIGMQNIKRQLELVYPYHVLLISSESDKFTVNLTIPLNNQL
ncbi:MAG: histidine kinase [Cytophagales bacterium]|nr:histidine kinase [Cytophagales bacterium]